MTPFATARVTLTLPDLLRALGFKSGRRMLWFALALGIALAYQLVAVRFFPEAALLPAGKTWYLTLFIGMTLLSFVGQGLGAAMFYRRLGPERRSATWEFFEDHVATASALGTGRTDWRAFVEVRETATALLFFANKAVVHVVPKRAFEDPGEVERVIDRARREPGLKLKDGPGRFGF